MHFSCGFHVGSDEGKSQGKNISETEIVEMERIGNQ